MRQEIIMGLRDHGVVGTVDLVEEISSYLSHHAEAPWFAEAAARLEDFLFYVERMQDEYGVTTEPVTPPKP